LKSSGETAQLVSTATLIGGGAAAVGAAILFFFTDQHDEHVQSLILAAILLLAGFQMILTGIVADLHALSVADAAPISRSPVDLSEIVREATEIVSALGETRDVSVEWAIDPHLMVAGDAIRLKQVLLNLGENAVKYTPSGGHVRITLTREARSAALEVADTGVGIPAAALPRVFDRFYRGESSGKGMPGTGLGLAIAKRIVEAHGGTIDADSRPGGGSTFQVRLPLASPPSGTPLGSTPH
jgi:signal transduction histidine kinase